MNSKMANYIVDSYWDQYPVMLAEANADIANDCLFKDTDVDQLARYYTIETLEDLIRDTLLSDFDLDSNACWWETVLLAEDIVDAELDEIINEVMAEM